MQYLLVYNILVIINIMIMVAITQSLDNCPKTVVVNYHLTLHFLSQY